MKNIIFTIVAALVLFSCKEEQQQKTSLKDSSGKINSLSVIIENQMWGGEVGDSIRSKFAAPVDGLPQQEPLFNISQYAPKLFEGFMTNSRTILIVTKTEQANFEIKKNVYAQPQTIVYVSGNTISEIINKLEEHSKEIISTFKAGEILENQRRIAISLLDDSKIKKKFNISLKIPTAYKYIIEEDKFFWIRKELTSGNNSILIYEVPIATIEEDPNFVSSIITLRDSIGQKHIQGTLANTHMVTEDSYAPYFSKITLKGKEAFETKGTWELKNDFMAGPFINYAIKDEANQRYLVVEGFCYNPSTSKRDLMHELEAIIKSITFLN
ncbi:DUF4837 family protein [Flavobacterium orientale]|uniref:DUF4837 domain-containing protein n=1 Tax=Flavobacterium orientale TaxID=1756020 RepID=A0A916XYM1_9FLAO|nr:DUF4837 family protein [Flavobacterium orientale]GGD22102.1 DUF4837 domain-containing protein [Flavobacterium orientale]